MVTNMRSAAAMAAIWVFAVVGVSATAWVAIDRAGRDITVTTVSSLPPASLNTPTLAGEPARVPKRPKPKLKAAPKKVAAPTPTAVPSPVTTSPPVQHHQRNPEQPT